MNNLFSSVHWCRNVSRYLGTSDVLDNSAPNCSLVRNVLFKVLRHSVTLWCPLLPYGYSCPVPDRVKPSFVFLTSGYSDAQGWASEYPDVKKYKWRLNPVWHRMLYSCIHMATVGVEGLKTLWRDNDVSTAVAGPSECWGWSGQGWSELITHAKPFCSA